MVQLSFYKMDLKLTVSSLRLCFVFIQTRPIQWCRKLHQERTRILIAQLLQHSLLAVCEIYAVSEECCRESHGPVCVCVNLCCQMSWHVRHIEIFIAMCASSCVPTVKQIHSHQAKFYIVVGWLHGGPCKTTKWSKLVGGFLHENGCLPGTIQ